VADDNIWRKEFLRLATVDEVPEDSMFVAEAVYWDVCIVNWKGEYYAFSRNCPHLGGEIAHQRRMDSPEVHCSSHGYYYDARSGASTVPEDEEPLQMYAARVNGRYIEVELETLSVRLPHDEVAVRGELVEPQDSPSTGSGRTS
jgi:nitrite reductase/ring-hydroxylating ferredoxin subunit